MADASRIVPAFRATLDAAASAVSEVSPSSSLYLYGSVATGQAVIGRSDVDLLAIDLERVVADEIARSLSAEHASLSRSIEIGTATAGDLDGDSDEAYGFRVFLRHYCVLLAGDDRRADFDFAADVRAARGFNGDIGRHRDRWRRALATGGESGRLANRIGRKTLLAVAGLVSVHDDTWTTDRALAATRWAEIEPQHRAGLEKLYGWVCDLPPVAAVEVGSMLDRVVDPLVERFATDIGLWT